MEEIKSDCIFCSIAKHKTPAIIEYEDETVIAFRDINPQAPIHVLIIPKKHIDNIESIKEEDNEILGQMFYAAKQVAQKLDVAENGFRLVINQGLHSGQVIKHLHMHLLGGKLLGPIA
jgi:histidine triad (HIT) family protein